MSTKLLNLIISKVDGPLFNGQVESVTVPCEMGEMTILAEHEAFISPLKKGTVTIRKENGVETHDVEGGLLEISNNKATVLV